MPERELIRAEVVIYLLMDFMPGFTRGPQSRRIHSCQLCFCFLRSRWFPDHANGLKLWELVAPIHGPQRQVQRSADLDLCWRVGKLREHSFRVAC